MTTGDSGGNGLATAEAAVERGARVVFAARNRDALEQVAADLRRRGGQVAICAADVSRQEDVEQIGRVALERFGGFDSWVNDAAAATYGRMDQVTLEDHRRIFDVNYHGLLMGSLVAARHLRQRWGHHHKCRLGPVRPRDDLSRSLFLHFGGTPNRLNPPA